MKAYGVIAAAVLLSAVLAPSAFAQASQPAKLTDEQLQKLVAPIALYPDALIAHILPASTVPVDVVEAARYLRDRGGKVEESPDVPWLPSVRALLRFPEVLYMLDEKLSWTQDLGNAVIAQEAAVMDAVQHVRKLAEQCGTLASNDKQTVQQENQDGDNMTRGFALVAWPLDYGHSGVMTFLVNHYGVVYEKDLGPRTGSAAQRIKRFNPDPSWRLVPLEE